MKPFCIKSLITILNIAQNVMENAETVVQQMIYSKLKHKREIIKCSSKSNMSLEFSFHGHIAKEIKYLGKCNLLINMLNPANYAQKSQISKSTFEGLQRICQNNKHIYLKLINKSKNDQKKST